MFESFENFLVNIFVCFSEVFSSFGMSKNNIFNSGIYEHCRGDFSCVCTFLFKVHVLSTNLDVCSLSSFYNRDDIDCRYAEYYVYFIVNY